MENAKHRGLHIIWHAEQQKYYVEGHLDWGWFDSVDKAKERIDEHLGPKIRR